MIIDANVYWFPEAVFKDDGLLQAFLKDIPPDGDTVATIKVEAGRKQIAIERPAGCPSVNYIQGEYTLAFMLEALEQAGVDRAVMKIPCCQEWMGIEMCRLFNDGMADFQKRSNGRLIALAVVPPYGTQESLTELTRCREQLGMHGVQLSAHYNGKYLDNPVFAPLFEQLNTYGMTAYIHHTPLPVQYDSLYEYNNLRRTYGRCADQTTAVARELFSGMFASYPRVRVVHSMLGGGFFAYLAMLLPAATDAARRFDATDTQLHQWLRDNIFFEMSHAQPWGKAQLECAVKTLGADHILYGSSFPVRREWLTEGAAFVRSLAISEGQKEQILSENAARLYEIAGSCEVHHA